MTTVEAVAALRRYAEHRIPTGGFLQAVLENDLMEAFARADETSRANLFEIVCFVYNELPSNCYGSKDKVREWLGGLTE